MNETDYAYISLNKNYDKMLPLITALITGIPVIVSSKLILC